MSCDPIVEDLCQYTGSDHDWVFLWHTKETDTATGATTEEPVDLTGSVSFLTIASKDRSTLLTVEAVILQPELGELRFTVTKQNTIDLSNDAHTKRSLEYDIEIISAAGLSTTILRGKFDLDSDRARR